MSEQYVGKLKKQTSKAGKEYFKGMFGKVPVVAFWGHKDPDQLNIKLDVGLIKWIDEQDDSTDKPGAPATTEQPSDEHLPF